LEHAPYSFGFLSVGYFLPRALQVEGLIDRSFSFTLPYGYFMILAKFYNIQINKALRERL